jgi:hypothetical protein
MIRTDDKKKLTANFIAFRRSGRNIEVVIEGTFTIVMISIIGIFYFIFS